MCSCTNLFVIFLIKRPVAAFSNHLCLLTPSPRSWMILSTLERTRLWCSNCCLCLLCVSCHKCIWGLWMHSFPVIKFLNQSSRKVFLKKKNHHFLFSSKFHPHGKFWKFIPLSLPSPLLLHKRASPVYCRLFSHHPCLLKLPSCYHRQQDVVWIPACFLSSKSSCAFIHIFSLPTCNLFKFRSGSNYLCLPCQGLYSNNT